MNRTKILAVFSKARQEGSTSMSSVGAAQLLTQDLGRLLAPEMPAKVRYSRIYRRMVSILPSLSLRRVRALHNGEVRRVDYEEMRALEDACAFEEARRAKQKLAATANALAAHLAAEGAPLYGRQMLALGRLAGALDRAGVGGDAVR